MWWKRCGPLSSRLWCWSLYAGQRLLRYSNYGKFSVCRGHSTFTDGSVYVPSLWSPLDLPQRNDWKPFQGKCWGTASQSLAPEACLRFLTGIFWTKDPDTSYVYIISVNPYITCISLIIFAAQRWDGRTMMKGSGESQMRFKKRPEGSFFVLKWLENIEIHQVNDFLMHCSVLELMTWNMRKHVAIEHRRESFDLVGMGFIQLS